MTELPYGYRFELEAKQTALRDVQQRLNAGDPRVSQRDVQIAANQLDNVERQIAKYREIEQRRLDEQATQQQAREAEAAAELERYKQQLQAAFPGTAAEFEAAWPQIKQQRQIEVMQQALARPEAEARSHMERADPGWIHQPIQQDRIH